jgi:hypothetical protein
MKTLNPNRRPTGLRIEPRTSRIRSARVNHTSKYIIKNNFNLLLSENVDCIHLDQDRYQWWVREHGNEQSCSIKGW